MRLFEAYPDRTKIVGLAALTFLMIAGSAYCATLPAITAKVAGYVGVAFFSVCLVGWCRLWLQSFTARVVFDETGVMTGTSAGVVEWCDITAFTVDAIGSTKFLSIHVHDSEKYLSRMSATARYFAESHSQLGVSSLAVSFVGLTPGLDDACYHLRELGFEIDGY